MTTAAVLPGVESLTSLLRAPDVSCAALAAFLDGLDEPARVRAVRTLPGRALRRLWTVCANAAPLSLDEFVPPTLAEGETLIYAGKNSLPLFSIFEKRFARHRGEIVGYNEGTTRPLVGPGYFTVSAPPDRPREVLIDYERVPATAPAGWPAVKPNDRGLSALVFGHLHDYLRRVSNGVVIGIGTRHGKDLNAWFVLARG